MNGSNEAEFMYESGKIFAISGNYESGTTSPEFFFL
jgi:hypothetical protein